MSLRYLLILLFSLLALAPVLLFRAWPHSELLERELADVEERHLLLARNLASALEHYAEDVHTTFALLARNRDLWGQSDGLVDVMIPLGLRHVCIVDRVTGRVLQALARPETPCPEAYAQDVVAGFTDPEGLSTRFSEVHAAADGASIMEVALSLAPGRLALGAIGTEHFVELGSAISFGQRGHAAIVDHAGNVLSHPRADWVRERRNILGVSAVQRMLRGETGIDLFYSPALETDMVAGFAPVPSTGWGAMVPQPIGELQAKVTHVRQSSFLVLLIGVSGALMLALAASYVMVWPMEALTRVARQVAAGHLELPTPLRFRGLHSREMQELYGGVRSMVLRLRKNQVRINKLAFFDPTTGLPNRECFRRRVDAFLECAAPGCGGALLFIDLDGFKAVNDTMGHDAGDHVLGQVGARLAALIDNDMLTPEQSILSDCRTATSVARLGGDEFALFLPHADATAAALLGERIRARIEVPYPYEERTLTLGASIGVASLPGDARDYAGLLKAADIAMYEAKRGGKNRVRVFSATPPRVRERRHDMAEDLFSCGIADQIHMHYQPFYAASDMGLAGVEGLIRWQHPKYGLLTPQSFFELVAHLGLKRQIDQIAFTQSISTLSQLAARGTAPTHLSLNVPVERLQDDAFVDAVIDGFPLPFRLSFELVEAAYCDVSVDQVHWAIDRLREGGVEFEMDDFGSSQASLTAMLALAPHRIKLDPRLTQAVVDSPGHQRMLAALIDMAHGLDVGVVAKGIESMEQARSLRALGVDYLQGFALSRPLSPEELVAYLAQASPVMAI